MEKPGSPVSNHTTQPAKNQPGSQATNCNNTGNRQKIIHLTILMIIMTLLVHACSEECHNQGLELLLGINTNIQHIFFSSQEELWFSVRGGFKNGSL